MVAPVVGALLVGRDERLLIEDLREQRAKPGPEPVVECRVGGLQRDQVGGDHEAGQVASERERPPADFGAFGCLQRRDDGRSIADGPGPRVHQRLGQDGDVRVLVLVGQGEGADGLIGNGLQAFPGRARHRLRPKGGRRDEHGPRGGLSAIKSRVDEQLREDQRGHQDDLADHDDAAVTVPAR